MRRLSPAAPSKPKRGQRLITVPLHLAMRDRDSRNTQTARLLGVSASVVHRMLNPKHHTKPEKIQAALGKRIVIIFDDAA